MIKHYPGTFYNITSNNFTFIEIFPEAKDFLNDYKTLGIPTTISDDSVNLLYYMLCGRRGNDSILSDSTEQFKYQLFTKVYQYGPTWEKQLDLQKKIREMTEREILGGSTQIYNSAANPSTPIAADPDGHKGTLSDEELNFITNQNTALSKRGLVDGYGIYDTLLKTDVSEYFLSMFDQLFNPAPGQLPLFYEVGE